MTRKKAKRMPKRMPKRKARRNVEGHFYEAMHGNAPAKTIKHVCKRFSLGRFGMAFRLFCKRCKPWDSTKTSPEAYGKSVCLFKFLACFACARNASTCPLAGDDEKDYEEPLASLPSSAKEGAKDKAAATSASEGAKAKAAVTSGSEGAKAQAAATSAKEDAKPKAAATSTNEGAKAKAAVTSGNEGAKAKAASMLAKEDAKDKDNLLRPKASAVPVPPSLEALALATGTADAVAQAAIALARDKVARRQHVGHSETSSLREASANEREAQTACQTNGIVLM